MIVENVVAYVYAKFGDDRLWNEKALADRKSDNNNNKNNVGGAWRPVSGSNKKLSYCWETVRRESMPRIAEMDVEMTT